MKKALVVLAILGAIALPASEAYAACVPSTPMFHGYGSYFACDESRGPVSAFAYQVSAPTAVNTGTEIITRTQDVGQVLISTDWANGGILGCPANPNPARVMIVVQDSMGKGILLSLSGASADLGYAVEAGHTFDPAGIAFPVPCSDENGRPHLNGFTATTVDVTVTKPKIYTDCDADSVGVVVLGGATCLDAFDGVAAGATIGGIYTSTQPCGAKPSTIRNAQWTRATVTPDANGRAVVPYTKPTNATDCAFVGTTTTVGGVEGGSINGFIQIGGLAAPPTAEGVRAAADSGKVRLSWTTSNEVGLAGFRLIAVSKSKGQSEIGSLIAAKGTPSSYTAEARMADLKGARSIIIRSVLNDGTTVDAAPVNF
jgi:hypothetical protein